MLCSLCICLCETRICSSVFPWVFTCLILVCRVETKNPYKDLYKLTAVQLGLLMVVLEEILEDDCPRVCMRVFACVHCLKEGEKSRGVNVTSISHPVP